MSVVDPAVRSVRIAIALCDRFAELLEGPSTVSATKQSGALFGVSGNEEALSLRIGEVQQTYPEIWRHLDDARRAFAARGVDVSAYDEIRATEGNAIGAAVDVQHTRGAGDYAVEHRLKSANFNREGHARAIRAYEALMRATSEIDWAGIARAEAEDPTIAAFTRATSRKRWIRIGLVIAVIAAPFVYVGNTCKQKQDRIDANRAAYRDAQQLSQAERAELDRAITRARQTLAAARQAWPAAVAPDALAALTPTTAPCEYRFGAPTARAADSFVRHGSIDGNYFGAGTFTSFGAREPVQDAALVSASVTLESIARRAAQGEASREDRALLRKLPAHVVFVVIDREVPPVAGATSTAGEVAGRGYVYSVARKQVVCAGVIDVRNAAEPVPSAHDDEAQARLFRELEVRIRQALSTELRAI